MLRQQSNAGTLIATVCNDASKIAALESAGAEVLLLADDRDRVALSYLWTALGERQVQKLLLEGGATLAGAALDAGLIDQLMLFIAPKMLERLPATGSLTAAAVTEWLKLLNLKPCV